MDLALTHSSYSKGSNLHNMLNNQRLEFLGDAVANLSVAEYLYTKYPDLKESSLSQIKSAVVSKDTFYKIALKLKLGDFILFGKSESKTDGKSKPSILEDTFEAVLGAIFLDKGYNVAKEWLINLLKKDINLILSGKVKTDYKSELQHLFQKKYSSLPEYKLVKEEGPEHQKKFTVHVLYKNKKLGEGVGSTKKEAEKMAAKQAILKLTKGGKENAVF